MRSDSIAASPLILTLSMDDASFAQFDSLRRAHFPPERNFIPAHITLFHVLPASEEEAVLAQLREVCAGMSGFALRFPGLRSLGRGVAVEVDSPGLLQLRTELAHRFRDWLSPQDRQGYRPHVTIQNKVAPAAARELMARLGAGWEPREGRANGLLLWRYLGGPWQRVEALSFSGT
ncbi:2'-5' RNA ligase [Noviherbaspirillum humi]|uniref:2'-5' RNA ligase n=1 Tax=Noviherbaspirillum humi TaxID=1688639 RepID=A0A239LXI4_9BURK|nr:2'-5' RNA ligase family protein [Noviherbaspirillum humi]SNT35377.1 2'-5' RNA ligase [Noviherbaspirillum humi]